MPELRLFHARNACSIASIIALEEAALPYTLEIVDLLSDRADYRKLVPSGRVPALLIDDRLLVESPAILLRIAALAPDSALAPSAPDDLSQLLSFLCWCSSSAHIARRRLRRPNYFTTDTAAQAAIALAARPVIEANMLSFDTRVRDRAWMGGDTFGVADAYAMVFYAWAILDGLDLSGLANLQHWATKMLVRPAVLKALQGDDSPALRGPHHASV